MTNRGIRLFTDENIREIRRQWDSRAISVRGWADSFSCSPETIRKIGRRDTYRDVPDRPGAVAPELGTTRPASPQAAEPTDGEVAASASRFAELLAKPPALDPTSALEELMGGPDAKPV